MSLRHCVLALAAMAAMAVGALADETRVRDAEAGVEFTLPAADWTLRDQSRAGVLCRVWSPSASLLPRFCVLLLPRAFFPEGLATRAAQLRRAGATTGEVTDAKVDGSDARRFEWTSGSERAVEYGIEQDREILVLQVSAPQAHWTDSVRAKALDAIVASVRLVGRGSPTLRVDESTPDAVRAARAKLDAPRTFAVRRHDVKVTLDPASKRLVSRDAFEVEALAERVGELWLHCSGVKVESVQRNGKALAILQPGDGTLRVTLDVPLAPGQRAVLDFAARADDFLLETDQKLIEEIGVVAQAREASSFSSHACYYPIDAGNDAAVLLEITVPSGFVAVSGGVEARPATSEPGKRSFAWRLDARPRLLPAGFAAGRLESLSAATKGGLVIEVHHLEGGAAAARERLAIALRAAEMFESQMGPLPWRRVAFCQVRPVRKRLAVSLPGLVLLSDAFFREGADVPLRADAFVAGEQAGALGVVDELAHQWNFYAALYPNELAEGLSTFACLLALEREAGAAEYAKAVAACAELYVGQAERETDVAVANPALYASPLYRVIAFAKVPAVLDVLRRRLGDAAFFAGWRAAFESVPRDRRLTYDDLRESFERASKQDLAPFFERWFFRPGHPRIRLEWEDASQTDRPAVRVRVTQVQPGEPFDLDFEVDVVTAQGAVTKMVVTRERESVSEWELPAPPEGVTADPRHRQALLRVVPH